MTEVVGVVLLFGLVVAGAAAIYVGGSTVSGQLTEEAATERATQSIQELDGRLRSVIVSPNRQSVPASLGTDGSTSVTTGGRVTVSVQRTSTCTRTLALDSIRYDVDEGPELVYQAGGVFAVTESGPTTVSPPAVGYRNGTLSVTTFNVSGGGADGTFTAVENATGTRERTRTAMERLFAKPGCTRPDEITVSVESQFPGQWREHFEAEFPDSASVTRTGDVVTLKLDEDELPRRADDDRNKVVDFTDGDSDTGELLSNGVRVDKGVGNTYEVSTRLLAAENGYNKTHINVTSNVSTTPVDIVFVIDESCSMLSGGCPSDTTHPSGTPIHEAKDATVQFIDELQGDPVDHRVAAVGFPGKHAHNNATYSGPLDPAVTHFTLTENLSGAKTQVRNSGTLDYATPTDAGLRDARRLLERDGNSSHKQVIVLLTDGKPTEDQPPNVPYSGDVAHGDSGPDFTNWVNETQVTNASGIPVYTVAVGGGADRRVTKQIADQTGGNEYHAPTAADLPSVFDDIYRDVSQTRVPERYVVNTPTVVDLGVGPNTVRPWVGSATPTGPGLNVQTPEDLSPSLFGVDDGQALTVNQTRVYDCTANTTTGATIAPSWNASKEYQIARCTAPGGVNASSTGATIYTNGSDLPTGAAWWWQNGTATAIPDELTTDFDGDGQQQLDLDKNEVVAVVEVDDNDGGTDRNNVVLLLDVGKAPSEVQTRWLVSVRVGDVRVEG